MLQKLRLFPASEIYHLCNKSIANYGIFKAPYDAERFRQTLDYYNNKNSKESFASYLRRKKKPYKYQNLLYPKDNSLLKFISYNVMPDHYHVQIKVLEDNCLSKYINDIENSYTRYFNIKYKRKGPLWQSPFRAIRMKTDEQTLHVSRYIHLNPTTAGLVENPEDWEFSSYRDYIGDEKIPKAIMTEITIKDPKKYKKFVEDQKNYQRKLKKIKKLLLE